jgi:hypothetical protein
MCTSYFSVRYVKRAVAQRLALNESSIHLKRLVFVDRIGGLVETSSRWRMGKWFTVFAENPAGFSGRKNCKEAIICFGRLRFAFT